ncbi:MAG: hypothetical protein ACU0BB_08535, partial [Paracoccaceae bacterium]
IRLVPNDAGAFDIELVGELAGLLSLGVSQNAKSHPKVACSTVLVAGARRKRSLLHAAWDITAVKRPKTEIDYDALLGLPSPSLP